MKNFLMIMCIIALYIMPCEKCRYYGCVAGKYIRENILGLEKLGTNCKESLPPELSEDK